MASASRDRDDPVLAVTRRSLQSSVEEDGDGPVYWGGCACGDLHVGCSRVFWKTSAVAGGGHEWKRADRGGAQHSGTSSHMPRRRHAERVAIRGTEATRGRACGDGSAE